MLLIGLFMVGFLKFSKTFTLGSIPEEFIKSGKLGAIYWGSVLR
jgi:hypothetical protein